MATPEEDVDSYAVPVEEDVDSYAVPVEEPAPQGLRTLAEGAEPSKLKAAAPEVQDTPLSFKDRVLRAANSAAVNTLSGLPVVGPAIRASAPYVTAAIDEVNPFSPSADYADRVDASKKEWEGYINPTLSGVSTALNSAAIPASVVVDGGINFMQSMDGKDLSDPQSWVDGTQSAAAMTLAPHAMRGGLNKLGQFVDDAVQPVARYLRRGANDMAASAVGLNNKSALRRLPLDAKQTIGQVLNETRVGEGTGTPLVAAGDTVHDILPKVEEAMVAPGETMGSALRTADAGSGGTGREVRATVANRKALDAQEIVKDALRRRALEGRIGANASMGRSKLEALTAAQQRNLDTRVANQDAMSKTHLAQVQDLLGQTADDVTKTADGLGTKTEQAQNFTRRFQDEVRGRVDQAPDAPALDPVASLPPEAREKLATDTAASQFGPLDVSRPETFAAAGDGADDLRKAYTEQALGEPRPPTDPRSFTKDTGFNMHAFVDRAEGVTADLRARGLDDIANAVDKRLKTYRRMADRGVSHSEANRIKTALQGLVTDYANAKKGTKQGALKAVQGILTDEIDTQMPQLVGEDAFREFVKSRAQWGALEEARKAALSNAKTSRGMFEMMGAGTGAGTGALVGLSTGGPTAGVIGGLLGGAGVGGAVHQARVRGPAAGAASLTRMAEALENIGVPETDPRYLNAAARVLGPERFQEFVKWVTGQSGQKTE